MLEILGSAAGGAAVAAVTTFTSENREKEIERIQTSEGLIPLGAAVAGDAILHSIPGINVLFSLLAEPVSSLCPALCCLPDPCVLTAGRPDNQCCACHAPQVGAACGVAYLMSIVLSAPSVDPNTLAPEGTVLNAKKAQDSRAALRVPFTQIISTVIKVRFFACLARMCYSGTRCWEAR